MSEAALWLALLIGFVLGFVVGVYLTVVFLARIRQWAREMEPR